MALTDKHLEAMEFVINGATIWGYSEAKILREVQQFNDKLIHILNIKELEKVVGYEFDGAKQMPYFGAILTGAGRKFLDDTGRKFLDEI